MSELEPSIRVSRKQVLFFYRQFQLLFEAGIPIDKILQILEANEPDDKFARVLQYLNRSICTGSSLSRAMSAVPNVFPSLVVAIVRAGEQSGRLGPAFLHIQSFTERGERMKNRLLSALAYPSVILVITLVVSLISVYFVIPEEKEVWKSQNLELPLFTQVVVGCLEMLFHPLTLIAALAVFTLIARLQEAQVKLQQVKGLLLHIPYLGPLLEKLAWSRVLHALANLLEAGHSFGAGMKRLAHSTGYLQLERKFGSFLTHITENGLNLHEAAEASDSFTPMVRQFLTVAEYDMVRTLRKVADLLDSDCESALAEFANFLEPMALLFSGLIIGCIVVALFLPTAQLVGNL